MRFLQAIKTQVLVLDGATGTMIQDLGLGDETPVPSGSQVDQVAESIIVASALVAEFRRHSVASTSPRLAARCARIADALDAALTSEFAEVFK